MKPLFYLQILVIFAVSIALGQVSQPPAAGSIPGGVTVSTNNFQPDGPASYPGPLFKETEAEKLPVALLPDPPDLMPPSAPEGSNYFENRSVHGVTESVPPITIASFAGMGQANGAGFPPDPYLAVGPDHIIQVINTTFRICTKTGTTLKTISFPAWFSTTISGVSYSDPKVQYDHMAGRWIMTILTYNDASQTCYDMVSVSDDSDPIGTWYNWAIPAHLNGTVNTATLADYPGLGFDNQAIYITSNHFLFGGSYQFSKIRIIGKAQLYANTAGPVTWTDFRSVIHPSGSNAIGIRPAVIYGAPNEYYLVAASPFTTGTFFTLYRITNPLTAPTLTGVQIPVTAWTQPPNAGQLGGGSLLIDGGGTNGYIRFEPTYRDSSIWIVHSAGNSGYSSVRYLRFNTVFNTAVEDVAFGELGYWHIYPGIKVDKDKNVAITFTRTGDDEYASSAMTWRLDSDPPGLQPITVFAPGLGNYVVNAGGRNRWGDYMGVSLDPTDESTFYMLTEYAAGTNTFGNWVYGSRLVPFSGTRISSALTSKDFGVVEAGISSDTATVTLYNIGDAQLSISSITKSQSAYSLLGLPVFPANLATFDSVTFEVYFHPTAHGVVNDTIIIASNDLSNPTLKIPLHAKGIVVGRAQVGTMYSASQTTGQLYSINVATGTPTAIGPFGLANIEALAIRPSNKELVGTLSNSTSTNLYRMSTGFGDALQYKTIPIPGMRAIAFTPTGDTLYGATTSGRVYRIDITTGDTTFVGANAGISFASLSFSPATGKLWAGIRPPLTNKDRIYTINTSTGVATLVGATGFTGQITPGLAFNALGSLYGITGSSTQINNFIRIDTLTAAGALVGSTGLQNLNGLALRTDSLTTGVDEGSDGVLPETYVLQQNYPNPFNPTTQIRYGLPQQSRVTLTIYNVVGQEVLRLVDGEQSAGFHSFLWNGTNASGASVASGIYFYKLEAHQMAGQNNMTTSVFSDTKKMLLLK